MGKKVPLPDTHSENVLKILTKIDKMLKIVNILENHIFSTIFKWKENPEGPQNFKYNKKDISLKKKKCINNGFRREERKGEGMN